VIRLSLEYRVSSIGFLFVCVLVGGQAVAQTAGTGQVGKPMQLLQLMNPDNSALKSHKRSGTKHTSKSHPAAKKHTSSKFASKESTPNGPPHAAAVDAAAGPPPVSSAPTSETTWAAVKAIRADIRNHLGGAAIQAIRADVRDQLGAAMQAIVAQNAAAVPTLLPGSAIAPPSKLIDSPTFRVASADDANIDLATDEHGAPVTDTLVATVTAMKATITETAAPVDPSDTGVAATSPTPDDNVTSTSWLLRVMGALGTAMVVGSLAWFLIGSAPLRSVSAPSVTTPA
jgi:hypothetical protein